MPALQIVQSSQPTTLSIVIPVLNEAGNIGEQLEKLQSLRQRGVEVIVVDGGSSDHTVEIATPLCDCVLRAPPGRATQMNAGAAVARGDGLLFLHADTMLPPQAEQLIAEALIEHDWGRFDVAIEGHHWMLPVIAALMNLRSRLTGIATGDQAMFLRRDVFVQVGGFPEIALMEDIALSAILRRTRPACLRTRVTTSGRRWEKNGVWRTILLMWCLRLAYFLGADPAALAVQYGYRRHDP